MTDELLLHRAIAAHAIVMEGDPRRFESAADELFPEERIHIDRAVAKRRREFVAGRALARAALLRLGMAAQPIPRASDGSPVWPIGVVGSISHTDRWCIAAVARSSEVLALGIDVEEDSALPPELLASICGPHELSWLERFPVSRRGALAKVVFSVKEAAYKAQFPLTGSFLDFSAMEVDLDPDSRTWRATFAPGQRPASCPWRTLTGSWTARRGLIATAALAPSDPSTALSDS